MTAAPVATATIVRLTLPEPPSTNRYWRVWRNRAVKSAEAHAYIATVAAAVAHQTTIEQRASLPLVGPVAVVLAWHRGARRGDLDNRCKVALDALKGCVFVDDSQVVALTMTRHESPRRGRLDVEVTVAE